MPDDLSIQSHKGAYPVHFDSDLLLRPDCLLEGDNHYLIDANIARLYSDTLGSIVGSSRARIIEATEDSKSIQGIVSIMEGLVADKVRRGHTLVAIGGGIIQDITCFIASVLMRGVPWSFVPTTLLAQADSCIGSKSSINLGLSKNILGTYYPPKAIWICESFLDTLAPSDMRSGLGEILKIHAIDSIEAFERLASVYDQLLTDRRELLKSLRESLRIKQRFIETDEFDQGPRLLLNYGHSFGHAIESTTRFAIPHGIAVTMGMDIANAVSVGRGLFPATHAQRMHSTLRKNYEAFENIPIPIDGLLDALMKDKKNTGTRLVLILPKGERARLERTEVIADDVFRAQCEQALARTTRFNRDAMKQS